MPHTTAPSPRTRVRRLPERAHYDADTIAAIVDAAMLCTVAFQLDGAVHAIPTIHWREGGHLYLHGAKASRMLKALTEGEACVTIALAEAAMADETVRDEAVAPTSPEVPPEETAPDVESALEREPRRPIDPEY